MASARKLTKDPKLGFLGWGLAGGFIISDMPGSGRGTAGAALVFVGVLQVVGALRQNDPPDVQGRLTLLLVVAVFLAGFLLYSGYARYSDAYDEELRRNKEGTTPEAHP